MEGLEENYSPLEIGDKLYQEWSQNHYFHAGSDPDKKLFTTVTPSPNITGQLHMGRALDNTM